MSLACPVCGLPLTKIEKSYFCENHHCFDIAKQGYVNLLPSGGGTHGDNAQMVEGRRTFLEKGYYQNLADALEKTAIKYRKEGSALLDIGCGEGYYTARLAHENISLYAFDISKDALKFAARRKTGAVLFAASAYKMPVLSSSIHMATLLFSPFCREEILRVLQPEGFLVMAIPDKEHLYGLKRAVYDTPYYNAPENTDLLGFRLLEDISLKNRIFLPTKEDILALFSMTPYAYKTAEKDRNKLEALSSLETETAFRLLIYQKL